MPSWWGNDDEPFDPMTTPVSPSLGVVADTFWRRPAVLRSDHFHAFAASGLQAATITADPLPLPPHIPASPVGRVYDRDGQVLLLGDGHDANTTLHLAEIFAGVPYGVPKYCTVLRDGRPVRIAIMGRTTIAVRASPSRTGDCGRGAFSPKGGSDMLTPDLRAPATLWRWRSSIWPATRSSSSTHRVRDAPNATRRAEAHAGVALDSLSARSSARAASGVAFSRAALVKRNVPKFQPGQRAAIVPSAGTIFS